MGSVRDGVMRNNQQQVIFISLVITVLLLYNLNVFSQQGTPAQDSYSENQQNEDRSDPNRLDTVKISSNQTKNDVTRRVWVTMGLCWGENTKYYGKEKFPYSEAAVRSVQLWHHLTSARVVMTIVHNQREPDEHLLEYRDKLVSHGAHVILHQETELSCVLASQLIRILAQQFHQDIHWIKKQILEGDNLVSRKSDRNGAVLFEQNKHQQSGTLGHRPGHCHIFSSDKQVVQLAGDQQGLGQAQSYSGSFQRQENVFPWIWSQ